MGNQYECIEESIAFELLDSGEHVGQCRQCRAVLSGSVGQRTSRTAPCQHNGCNESNSFAKHHCIITDYTAAVTRAVNVSNLTSDCSNTRIQFRQNTTVKKIPLLPCASHWFLQPVVRPWASFIHSARIIIVSPLKLLQ